MKNCKKSLSEKVKQLRQQKAWSQSHLAEAAGLSTRTVQRLEQTGNCSDETLLCLAAAFDIGVDELTSEVFENDVQEKEEYLWRKFTPKSSFITGLLLMIPGVLFVISNVLKYELNQPWLYDSIVIFGEKTGLIYFSSIITHPFFLLGSLSIALILGVLSQVQVKGKRTGKEFTIWGVQLSLKTPNSLVLIVSVMAITILIGYATIENLADWVVMILDSNV